MKPRSSDTAEGGATGKYSTVTNHCLVNVIARGDLICVASFALRFMFAATLSEEELADTLLQHVDLGRLLLDAWNYSVRT
jgi:hypothetical protein